MSICEYDVAYEAADKYQLSAINSKAQFPLAELTARVNGLS